MGEDFRAAPMPIRLSCRYSNGTVVSFVARALTFDDSSLKVLSVENFEKGVQLNVLAPFLEGIASCRVLATSRSREQPGYFDLDLKFLKKPQPAARPKETHAPISEDLAMISQEMAAGLEQGETLRFSQVLQAFLPAQRLPLLAVSAAALAVLLQEKGLLDLKHLVGTFTKKSSV